MRLHAGRAMTSFLARTTTRSATTEQHQDDSVQLFSKRGALVPKQDFDEPEPQQRFFTIKLRIMCCSYWIVGVTFWLTFEVVRVDGFQTSSHLLSQIRRQNGNLHLGLKPLCRNGGLSRLAVGKDNVFSPLFASCSDEEGTGHGFRETLSGATTEYIPLEITCDPDLPCDEDGSKPFLSLLFVGDEINWNVLGPLLAPVVAFSTFELVAEGYSFLAELLSSKNWVAADGGAYQARIIAPAINGVVIPAVALLFATLTSTTINTLRQRQVDVRQAINMEAGELRAIECLVDAIEAGPVQDQCRDYLIQYTSRILNESRPRGGAGDDVINPRCGMDSELNAFTAILNAAHGTTIPGHVGNEIYGCVGKLREQRVKRISALQCVYPDLHYRLLFVLAAAMCTAFLIETNQELLVFLNAFQLRVLWSMLVGTFVSCFAVFADLRAPFCGIYQASDAVDQLHTIKLTLQASRQVPITKRTKHGTHNQAVQEKVNGS